MDSARRDLFPLRFKREKPEYHRGLSINEAEKLPDLPNHYLNPMDIPPRKPWQTMTIVWDLDQTLVCDEGLPGENWKSKNHKLIIRPRATQILDLLKSIPEVEFIVWTAGIQNHAKKVCYSLGIDFFDYVISRSEKYWWNERTQIKDLNILVKTGRPLNSMIHIDDRMDVGLPHPENLLIVPQYWPEKAGEKDATMLYLANVIYKACTDYIRNGGKYPLRSFLHSPLTQKCREKGLRDDYYGIYGFASDEQIDDRIREFK